MTPDYDADRATAEEQWWADFRHWCSEPPNDDKINAWLNEAEHERDDQ